MTWIQNEVENIFIRSSLNFKPVKKTFQQFLLNYNDRTNSTCDYSKHPVNIVSLPTNIAIGHCVSQCSSMSKGIALQFKNKCNNRYNHD